MHVCHMSQTVTGTHHACVSHEPDGDRHCQDGDYTRPAIINIISITKNFYRNELVYRRLVHKFISIPYTSA